MLGWARPVRILLKLPLRASRLFFIRLSASFWMSLITLSTSVYQRAFLAAHYQVKQGAGLVHVEDAHRHVMVPHQANSGQIHDAKLLVQCVIVTQAVILNRIGVQIGRASCRERV